MPDSANQPRSLDALDSLNIVIHIHMFYNIMYFFFWPIDFFLSSVYIKSNVEINLQNRNGGYQNISVAHAALLKGKQM